MKKKIVTLMLSAVLAVSMLSLTACGGAKEEPKAEATEEAAEEEADEEEADEEEVDEEATGCSDEVFKALQDDYAILVDNYNLLNDYYMNNDDIAQSDDVEEAFAAAQDAMDQMGEITQDSITDADAEELDNMMVQLNDSFKQLAEGLDLMAADGAAANAMCSDENFAALQDGYKYLTECYDAVENYYLENDSIPQSDDVEEYLTEAKDLLDQMGEVTQDSITDADAEELANAMITLAESLEQVANAL